MGKKRCVRFVRALALGGLAVSMGACGDDEPTPADTQDADVADLDTAEPPDTNGPDLAEPDWNQPVDGPLAPPDMPVRAA